MNELKSQPWSTTTQIATTGRNVIFQEAEALRTLAQNLPPDFASVVERILQCDGRVIVSGVGKSGHIARKIAATLASTGTPSIFLHPTEASHGDMGIITPNDLCLLLSNSGTTRELQDIVAFTRRFAVPLIAISSGADSFLMTSADYRLTLPACPEACAIGMAPTTSTTLAIALGDALAVALMAERDFQPGDFHALHPGGRLGAQLATVAQVMHGADDLPLVPADAMMDMALIEMTSKGFGMTGVTDAGRLVGVISDGDLRRNMPRLLQSRAREVATLEPITTRGDVILARALALMTDRKITALFVVDDDRTPIGLVHMHDLLRIGVV